VTALQQKLFKSTDADNKSKLESIVSHIHVVRRSLDARRTKPRPDGRGKGPRFVYVVDIVVHHDHGKIPGLKHVPGRTELWNDSEQETQETTKTTQQQGNDSFSDDETNNQKKKVIIVGSGPAGLFCALELAKKKDAKIEPILLERGQPVELRGKDIGALMHRRELSPESNFCFGEGGAGTWSDGKLSTRIGRNSRAVRSVLETLVSYGAPSVILVDGAPHLGTDNLVRLLRNMRLSLQELGTQVRFGTQMTKVLFEGTKAIGVEYTTTTKSKTGEVTTESGVLYGDAVVLATGHSARDVYEELHQNCHVQLEPKGFAVGFRVEHPQHIINQMQYGLEWGKSVKTGKAMTDRVNENYFSTVKEQQQQEGDGESGHSQEHERVPVPSYRLATDQAWDGANSRGVYSFCMCPGGQIVPASTDPTYLCVNGMSFSRRDSTWANSALVVTVSPNDPILDEYKEKHGVLAGVAFQRDVEEKAAILGGGNLTVPVQRVTDFIAGTTSETVPSSSYRLGVKPSPCHELYPPSLTAALRDALVNHFEKQMPGFACKEGLLHGVETRTSSPVRISRDEVTMEARGVQGLFPAGEGAGFAGGIVSAAVDGLYIAEAVNEQLFPNAETNSESDNKRSRKAVKSAGDFY